MAGATAGQMTAMQGQISELKVANKMLMERQAALEAKLSDHTERSQVRCYSRQPLALYYQGGRGLSLILPAVGWGANPLPLVTVAAGPRGQG